MGPQHVVTVRVLEAPTAWSASTAARTCRCTLGDEVHVTAREQPIRFVEPRGALPFWELLAQEGHAPPDREP